MIQRTSRWFERVGAVLLGASTLFLFIGCGGGGDLELRDDGVTGVSTDDGKADRPDLALEVLQGFTFSPAIGRTETRKVFTSATSFRAYFGQAAPAAIDFGKRWLVFYSAGVVQTRGYVAEVTRARTTDTGKTLKIATRLSTPGQGCAPATESNVPAVLVAFTKPVSPTPTSTSFEKSTVAKACAGAVAVRDPDFASGLDTRDRTCGLIVREARRPNGPTGGYETTCETGSCVFVFAGTFDVSDARLAGGGVPVMTFRASTQPGWFEVPATATAGAPSGMKRFAFRLVDKTAGAGMSFTSLSRFVLELWATVKSPSASPARRVFDEASFILDANSGWSVAADPTRCAPVAPSRATLRFLPGSEQQQGLLFPGGKLAIEYSNTRLLNCRGTHNGYPAWDTRAFVRFLPSGDTVDGSVRGLRSVNGTPTNEWYDVPFETDIPRGATSAQIWFRNAGGVGDSCEAWDSRFGQNYAYGIAASRPAAVAWAGDFGGSFARDCVHRDGLAEPIVIDSYVMQRACSFVDADVYVQGLTDSGFRPEAIAAQVELSVDGAAPSYAWLDPVERIGNNARFRWQMPRGDMANTPWQTYRFALRFSTDGVTWFRVGQGAGPAGGAARTVQRQF